MESRQIRYFAAIADAGSFSAAAAQLHIAQPALSRQIATLERDLGTALFVRRPNGVVLTAAGEVLRRHAAAMQRQVRQARTDIADLAGATTGWLSFGSAPSIGRLLFGPVATDMVARFPGLHMSFVEGVGAQLLSDVADGTLDAAISSRPAYAPGIVFKPLFREPVYLIAALGKTLPDRVADWSDLQGLPLVVTNQQAAVASWVEELSGLARETFDVRFRVESAAAARDLVGRGLAYGVMPHSTLAEALDLERFNTVRMEAVTLDRNLAWSRKQEHGAAFRGLLETIVARVRELIPADQVLVDADPV